MHLFTFKFTRELGLFKLYLNYYLMTGVGLYFWVWFWYWVAILNFWYVAYILFAIVLVQIQNVFCGLWHFIII